MTPIHNQAREDPDRRVGGTAAKILLKIRPALRKEGSRSVSDQTRPDQTCGSAARRIRTCNQGIQGPPRFREAWTISPSPIPDPLTEGTREAGRSRRGLLLGLTPLVSEPSWPPMPDQAWLRITMPRRSLGFPQFTRIASGGYPPAPPFACR